jgi:hypothetical protein
MTIYDWFDPDNKDHIKGYNELQDTGMWPKGFIPNNVTLVPNWHVIIPFMLADRWVKHMLEEK